VRQTSGGWRRPTKTGLESRDRLAAMIGSRFGLDGRAQARVLAELRGGLIRQIVLDGAVIFALRDARAAGWVPFVVSNGTVEQQERKLRHTGARPPKSRPECLNP
jgi:putative hydrolase of the HAD superfamily